LRRTMFAMATATMALLVSAVPTSAQSEPTVGDSGPAVAYFDQTDGACNYPNFSDDTYEAELGEDDRGRFIRFTQASGDTGIFRLDASGNLVFVTDGDEVYDNITVNVAGVITARYLYNDDGCVQEWLATVTLPPGYLGFLASEPVEPEEAAAPPPTVEEQTPPPEAQAEPPEEPASAPTTQTPQSEELAQPSTISDDDSGISFLVWVLIAVIIALFGWGFYWFFFVRKQRLYRFDRGDAGEFIDDDDSTEIVIGGMELPTFGAIEEGEQVFLPPRASEIDVGVPPAHRLCDTAHEAWRESVERLAQLEAEADASVGTDDPIPDIHSRMLDEARDSMNAYRAIYEECLTANPDEVPQAPPSTAAPGPSTGDDADDDAEDEPVVLPPVTPGIINEPPEVKTTPDCKPNEATETRAEQGLPEAQFTVLSGVVSLPSFGPLASWNRAFGGRQGGLSSGQLLDVDEGDIESALSDADSIDSYLTTRFGVTVNIPTTTYKVGCGRVWRCDNGTWTKTSEIARLKDEVIAQDVETVNGHNAASKIAQVSENISTAQNRVEVLVSNQEKMQAFGCE
jgi:hypothetical protein